MGFLDPGSESDHLGQQNVDLPLWYCLGIEGARNQTFKFEIPEIYRSVFVDICKADAKVVNLGKLNKYFFQFGHYISRFDMTGGVKKMLLDTFRVRMKFLKDQIHNDEIADVKNQLGLDNLEYHLFVLGSKNLHEFNKWMKGEMFAGIQASEMVKQHRRRLLEDNQEDDIV